MDPYQRVEQVGPSTPAAEEHEIKVQTQSRIWNSVAYATTLLEENKSNTIVLKAVGEAISRAVLIAELIKKKTPGLHQNISIGTTDKGEAWKPLAEDLLRSFSSKTTRYISLMTITLSKKELDTSSPGYQSPVLDDQMKASRELDNGDLLPSIHAGHDGHRVHDGRWRGEGNITETSDLNVNRGLDARCGYNRGRDAGRGRGRGRYQAFQDRGRGYGGEIGSGHGMEIVHQESGNISEASDRSANRGWDAGRSRGRGRYQAFQLRGRGGNGEIGSDLGMENVHQESGNISEASDLSANRGWDAGRGRGRGRYQAVQLHGRGGNGEIRSDLGNISEASNLSVNRGRDAGRGRGRGRYQAFQGHGRAGYGESGSDLGMENVHQESGNTSESSDHSVSRGWDAGYGRARGHGRDQAFPGQGRGYSAEVSDGYTENMHRESGGRGNISESSDQSVNRGWDAGRGRGHIRDQAFPREGRGYSGEIGGGFGTENMHQQSGNIKRMSSANRGWDARNGCAARGNNNGMPELRLNRDWDAMNDYAARGRERGRDQASQGRGRQYGVEVAAPRENLRQESGNINVVPNLSMNGCAWRGRGLQRHQGLQGRGRGYTGEIGGDYGRQNMHQESGNMNGMPDDNTNRGRDARHGYTGRARGRGRNLPLRGRGRAYNTEISARYGRDNMQQESRGCEEFDEHKEPATQEPAEQHDHLDNIETPVATEQLIPTIDNLPLDSTCLAFDRLGDDDISRIGSACGFIISGSGVALVRLLERERAKLGIT